MMVRPFSLFRMVSGQEQDARDPALERDHRKAEPLVSRAASAAMMVRRAASAENKLKA